MCVICGLLGRVKGEGVWGPDSAWGRTTAAPDWSNGDTQPQNNPLRLFTVTVITVS